ncbi:MAG: pilus assembly protein [Bdellovibrionales bacterium]|nr:pilus assembly protein [Bdellovibrionales bacterium]
MLGTNKIIKSRCSLDERGVAMVETAITLPLFVLILFGLIQWGMILAGELTLRNAAAVAARSMIVGSTPPTSTQVEATAKAAMRPLLDPDNNTTSVVSDPDYTSGGLSGAKRVQISHSYPLLFSFVVPGSAGTFTMNAEAVMK